MTLTFSRARAEGLPPGVDAIVATADLQGRAEQGGRLIGELVAEELGVLAELGVIPEPGVVLMAGDFYDDPACAKRGRSGEVGPVWRAFSDRFPTVAGVHGNHDVLTEVPPGATVLDGRQESIAGIRLAGICGIMGRHTRPQRRSPESYLHLYERLLDDNPEILLSHCGPDEPSYGRIGDPAIREILQRKGETLTIFGHCHWPDPLAEIGENQALNVDGRVVVLVR